VESTPYGEIIEESGQPDHVLGARPVRTRDGEIRVGSGWRQEAGAARLCADRLPDLEVRSGGSTSIDVTRKGIDKAYGMRKLIDFLELSKDEVLFVGDRLDEGGNDYPVKAMGIDTVAVTRWQDTAEFVLGFLDRRAGKA